MTTQPKNPQHSSESVEHYTPEPIVEAARSALVKIDLDPASCAFANGVVRADEFFDRRGLDRAWRGRVLLNPPGGAERGRGSRSSAVVWWRKLVDEWASDRVQAAVFVGFSVELLQACQPSRLHPLDLPCCFPAKRIRFDASADELIRALLTRQAEEQDPKKIAVIARKIAKLEPLRGRRVSGDQPTHSNVIVGLPDASDPEWVRRFRDAFFRLGFVHVPEAFSQNLRS